MRLEEFGCEVTRSGRRWTATVVWEELQRPPDPLFIDVADASGGEEIPADAFLLAAFPYACLQRERRLHIDAAACPMLVEGLHTVHAWWRYWEFAPSAMPRIEVARPAAAFPPRQHRRTTAFLSGGVDSLHMLRRNRMLYRRGDVGYIEDAILVHGFDIGKKKSRGAERDYFAAALGRLQPVADELGLRLVTCSTNLRHLPAPEGAWLYQFHGAALAAMGHAVAARPGLLFLAGTYDVPHMSYWGSHPCIDVNYSSQRLTLVHDGIRFSRLEKVQELVDWPAALDNMRSCTENPRGKLNCGECEKCIRTRLELLAAGCEQTRAFGRSAVEPDLVERVIEITNGYQASCFADVVAPIRTRGFDRLAATIERKLDAFARRSPR
jgi:hypothetical protein